MMSYCKQKVNILRYEIRLMQKINSHFYIHNGVYSMVTIKPHWPMQIGRYYKEMG